MRQITVAILTILFVFSVPLLSQNTTTNTPSTSTAVPIVNAPVVPTQAQLDELLNNTSMYVNKLFE